MDLIESKERLGEKLNKYKIPLLVLLMGLLLLVMPARKSQKQYDDDTGLAYILEQSRGVGKADVLISENGAVIVCDGAGNPEVKLNVLKAAEAYTGFSGDKIQVLVTKQD